MCEEILCDNCEALPATEQIQGFFLCAICKETYEDFENNLLGEMGMSRNWVNLINPSFINPSKQLIRIVALLRAVWPYLDSKDWRFMPGPKIESILIKLDSIVTIRMNLGFGATVAMIILENPDPYQPSVGGIKRMALRNTEWIDIFGWVNSAKTWYDRRDETKLQMCVEQGHIKNERLLSTPLRK